MRASRRHALFALEVEGERRKCSGFATKFESTSTTIVRKHPENY
jgi:hypothetical protein